MMKLKRTNVTVTGEALVTRLLQLEKILYRSLGRTGADRIGFVQQLRQEKVINEHRAQMTDADWMSYVVRRREAPPR